MSIIIGTDSFLALRNVRNGDLGTRLQALANDRVVVLVDPAQLQGARETKPANVEVDALLPFDAHLVPELRRYLVSAYYTRKGYYDPATVWTNVRASIFRKHPRAGVPRILRMLKARLSLVKYRWDGRRGLIQTRRLAVVRMLRQHPIIQEYQRYLREQNAQLVAGFSLEGPREMALLEAAHTLQIPVAVMIRSRDNLAAKIQHLPDASAYFVWSEVTRNYLAYLYPEIPLDRVQVTGSPQFDHHVDPAYRLPRAEFFARIGLDPDRPLIVYSTATPQLISHESEMIQHLADAIHAGKLRRGTKTAQLLVRGHPRGFGSSFSWLSKSYPGVAVYPAPAAAAYRSPEHEDQVVRLIAADERMHLSTLAWQDVQVNICGTMSVDSAIFDKPVVNLFYDLPATVPAGLSVRGFYERSDYQPIIESGGVRLARSPDECLASINQYLADPHADAAGRKKIRDTDCGPLDGRAGERIARQMSSLLCLKRSPMPQEMNA